MASRILPRRKEAVVEDLTGELHRANRRIDLLIDERSYWQRKSERLQAENAVLKAAVEKLRQELLDGEI